jgi:hypothetical protein
MLAHLAGLVLVAGLTTTPPCSAPGNLLKLYLEAESFGSRDSMAHVHVCMRTSRDARVSSFSARIVPDTAFGRVIDVERTIGPAVIARADSLAGTVLVAGASSGGLIDGSLLTIRVRLARAGTLPKISVVLTGMNGLNGMSLATRTNVIGLDAKCVGDLPALFEALPPAASADPGEVLDLRLNGCGFSANDNTVKFGDVTVRNVKSTDDGTHIRVVIPKDVHGGGEVPPMQLGAGIYDVTVNNGRGTSNAKRVALR